ncbi:MAG: hypothetical protein M3Z27_01630 [Actinomycetota bacterium]|nr:hypothetical protein [Actinomycetota bacterium]
MEREDALVDLGRYVAQLSAEDLTVHRAAAAIDERQDGEEVTRVILLVSDPEGETWDVQRVRELREALGRKATELGLPPVSLTLVPESEAELVEAFTR